MKKGIITATATLVTLATSCFVPAFAAQTAASANETYTVQSGDTFYNISAAKGISLSSLEMSNPQIQNFTNIFPGQIINLPLMAYTVQAGDTLYKISAAQGVPLTNIEAVNPQMTDYTSIFPGQIINIPTTTIPSSITTPAPTPSSSSPVAGAPATAAPTTPAAAKRQAIIHTAESYFGVHYAWGGNTPSVGFDCSGFVGYVFGQNGITLPRESHDMAYVGVPVSQSQLQPGDLLFFKDTDSSASLYANHVTHVGIYIGNEDMIESSSSHNNEGVVIVHNVFSNPYYTSHYYGARNVIG